MRSPSLVRMPRRLIALLITLVALAFLAGCGGDDEGNARDRTPTGVACEYPDESLAPTAKEVDKPPTDATVSGEVAVTFETSVGTVDAILDADSAPCTVNSFVALADQGYFDGTSCHRMTTEGIFVLQCGDPSGTGGGTPGYTFADELDGDETYGAGTLAMANRGENTNGSQFFIVYAETPLPPAYTVFGTVDEAAVALIQGVADDGSDESNGPGDGTPLTPVEISSVVADRGTT